MKYILIKRIKVQNANAIAGFTWGFPAITHFLGFTHNLAIKLVGTRFQDIQLKGCAVVCHEHQVHTFRPSWRVERPKGSGIFVEVIDDIHFTQSRNPPCMYGLNNDKKAETAPIIEEGKMNMTVSLLIGCEGNIGNRMDNFKAWLKKQCELQRLAGGTVLSIKDIDVFGEDSDCLKQIKFNLLPGFMLMDRSDELENHYNKLRKKDSNTELLDAWLDFSALKQKARPKSELIGKHLSDLVKSDPENRQHSELLSIWAKHLESPYDEGAVPTELKNHFAALKNTKQNDALLKQWQSYCNPTDRTDTDWEYVQKPASGYLVPIMTGYKAISQVYENNEVENTRDHETDVCFVEAVHSVGEWKSVHRLKRPEDLRHCLWNYPKKKEKNWYLCKQGVKSDDTVIQSASQQEENDVYEEEYD